MKIKEDIVDNNPFNLNEEQLQAVENTEGPLLVLAGAGTGKTKVLTSRIANLLIKNKAVPTEILAVTFTNKAAKEMQNRVEKIVGARAQGVWLGTFHSIAAKILRRHAALVGLDESYAIIDPDDQLRLIKKILAEPGLQVDDKVWPAKLIMYHINSWKDKGLTPDKITAYEAAGIAEGKIKLIYNEYQQRLKMLNAADFGDLLLHNLTIFLNHANILAGYAERFRYIMVDEYQDTNIAQYLWLRLLAQGHNNLCCVGDDDQSIYGWRGAEVGNILKFEKDFENAKVIRLERNYRSTSHILNAASSLIANNDDRLGKTLWTEDNEGEPIRLVAFWDENEEARFISQEAENLISKGVSPKEIAVLVRAGFQTRAFEESFLSYQIPYKVVGGLRFYERMEIRDVVAYIRCSVRTTDSLAFERIINTPKRGIGPSTIAGIVDYAKQHEMSLIKATKEMLEQGAFKAKAEKALRDLVQNLEKWSYLFSSMSLKDAVKQIMEESGYLEMWKREKTIESQGRIENLKELLLALEEFEDVESFLEHISLVSELDNNKDAAMVSVMTLHSAKGLEFDTVFLPGWENGLFPHQRSIDEKGNKGVEEERRLAYVGITRAKRNCYICFAGGRRFYNRTQYNSPSKFIEEIPADNIEVVPVSNGMTYYPSNQQKEPVKTKKKFVSEVSSSKFKVGDRVSHIQFGLGIITAVKKEHLEIAFEQAGFKKIVEDFVEKV